MKKIFVIAAALLILLAIAACAAPAPAPSVPQQAAPQQPPSQPQQPVRGGTFLDATFGDAASLQPLITSDNASSNFQALLYAPLMRTDPKTLERVGVLYEGPATFNADGSKLTMKLRQGLKWSDGNPITTKDIIFTWDKMMDPKVNFIYRKTYQDAFTEVKALDDYTVEYTLKTPGYCPAGINASLLDRGPLPKHIFENLDINQNDVNNKPTVTSGYFKFKDWQKDDHFTANPGYESFIRGQPLLDAYTYRIVKDNTVQTQLFKTQDVDVAYPDPVDWDEITKLPFAQPVSYYSAVGASWVYIGFNLRNPLLADKSLRQAISTAINTKEFVDKIRLGHAKPQYSNLPSSSWAAADEKDLTKFPFDPAKAKKMLDDAGYKVGPDGMRVSKDGKPLKFRLEYNAGNKQREQIAIITQQYLKDVGIAADVNAVEWTAYLDKVNKTFDMDMYILGWVGGYDPASTKNIWGTGAGQNSTGYSNPKVDELYKKAETVPGCKQADRKAVYVEIQKILAEDQPYVFLYTSENLEVYNKRINLLPVTGLGVSYNLEQYSVNPAAKK